MYTHTHTFIGASTWPTYARMMQMLEQSTRTYPSAAACDMFNYYSAGSTGPSQTLLMSTNSNLCRTVESTCIHSWIQEFTSIIHDMNMCIHSYYSIFIAAYTS